ncbi:peptide chain release factor N(5)-glutamine methyltransferase [Caldalkalibacillus salinus]|uniref:peptide chain release factor N(5)-glutamine methyltransferase n=1 Tax=Caldalkalibacillus salinus TaxID=2803787 RepID=UPI001921D8CF|nr:peptide chain release factor N(5)-glutamine methyltransferase [Caldalkalibacillus salinus]
MSMMTYREALRRASSLLEQKNQNPKIADWLLRYHANVEGVSTWLTLLEQRIDHTTWTGYQADLERVLSGEPYQYVIGEQDFYGRTFEVTPAVLIPRPETELLVEQVLSHAKQDSSLWTENDEVTVVDVGTGSGAIAVSLALEEPRMSVKATDISSDALAIAKRNAQRLEAHVQFFQGDLAEPLITLHETVQILVSNPPYVARTDQHLERQVVEYEPHVALFSAEDGLYHYRQLIQQSKYLVQPGGWLAFEVGIDQAQKVHDMIRSAYPDARIQTKKDYQGLERMVLAKLC